MQLNLLVCALFAAILGGCSPDYSIIGGKTETVYVEVETEVPVYVETEVPTKFLFSSAFSIFCAIFPFTSAAAPKFANALFKPCISFSIS